MKTPKSAALTNLQLIADFEEVRSKLLSERFSDRLDKPLAFWAMPDDRRLPFALLDRTLRELLAANFDDLYATPGIGRKKICSLVELLSRAAQEQVPGIVVPARSGHHGSEHSSDHNGYGQVIVDPATVSEAAWAEWRACILTHGLGEEPLGRLAASLQHLPRVIWSTSLKTYTHLTLAEMRALKTYGEKRVRSVIEIFGSLYQSLVSVQEHDHIVVRLAPRFVYQLEGWIQSTMMRTSPPSVAQLREGLVDPLLRQVQVDAGEQVGRLAESRVVPKEIMVSVRQLAFRMGLTQARVYQLLDDISMVMQVRWPEGRSLLASLGEWLEESGGDPACVDLLLSASALFFPKHLVGAAEWPGGKPHMAPIDYKHASVETL
jgi:hypothetical protein